MRIADKFETIKIRKTVKKELEKKQDSSGMSYSDIIALGLPGLDAKCSTCGKPFIEYAFIYTHDFKR